MQTPSSSMQHCLDLLMSQCSDWRMEASPKSRTQKEKNQPTIFVNVTCGSIKEPSRSDYEQPTGVAGLETQQSVPRPFQTLTDVYRP